MEQNGTEWNKVSYNETLLERTQLTEALGTIIPQYGSVPSNSLSLNLEYHAATILVDLKV